MEMTITVRMDRENEVSAAIRKLQKKAKRYGSEDIKMQFGAPWCRIDGMRYVNKRVVYRFTKVVDVVFSGEAPRVGEYEFLARIDFVGGGKCIVNTVPGAEIPEEYRNTDSRCEHCGINRHRKNVFVVRGEGRTLQVGRTCLRDFLGIDDPEKVIGRFQYMKAIRDSLEGYGSSGEPTFPVEEYLAYTCAAIRLYGWTSSKQAREEELISTSGIVDNVFRTPSLDWEKNVRRELEEAVTECDFDRAVKIRKWFEAHTGTSEYIHNVRSLITEGDLPFRYAAFIASAAYVYLKDAGALEGKKRAGASSVHVGTVGERLRGIMAKVLDVRFIGSGNFGDTYLLKFEDASGNLYSWFTSRTYNLEPGENVVFAGTVKKHQEYQGIKETQLSRVKLA